MNNDYQECINILMNTGILAEEECVELADRVLQETIVTSEQIGHSFKSVINKISNCNK